MRVSGVPADPVQHGEEVAGALHSGGWILGQTSREQRGHGRRHVAAQFGDGARHRRDVRRDDQMYRREFERGTPTRARSRDSQTSRCRRGDRTRGIGGRLLRGHVGRRSDHHAGLGQRRVARVGEGGQAHRLGDAKIRDHGRATRKNDVVRLHVAMHDAMFVRVGESARDIAQHVQRVGDGQRPGLPNSFAERLTFFVRHDEEERAIGFARVVQRYDVGMTKPRGDLDLA